MFPKDLSRKLLTPLRRCDIFSAPADVAELVDAHDSGSCGLTPVGVRVSLSAPNEKPRVERGASYF